MDLPSGRRLLSQPPPPPPPPPPQHDGASCCRRGPSGADRISNLSDDMILLVLARLHCVRTAVRTGLLSRRWRGLWTRLTHLVFDGVAPATIQAALSRFGTPSLMGTPFQLDIHLPSRPETADADSLMRTAALLSPTGLVITVKPCYSYIINTFPLPCFQHATSIELDTQLLDLRLPAAGEFPALERLSLRGRILNTGALVTRCPRLRLLTVKFHSLGPNWIREELASLKRALGSREVAVSLIDISISQPADDYILRGAAKLSPQQFVYTNSCRSNGSFHLPFFHRTTSMEINQLGATFKLPSCSDKFFALERLCLFGCNIVELGKLVACCPCMRVLKVDGATSGRDITVHSTSLQELVLGTYKECRGIDIVTPGLKRLAIEVHAGGHMGTSISTPVAEKVSWRRSYTEHTHVVRFWLLRGLSLETVANNGKRVFTGDVEGDTWLSVQREPHTYVLSMDMCASDPTDANLNFAREIEKLPVTHFSTIDLHLEAMGHAYGATLLHLLEVLPVHNAIKLFKITLLRSEKPEVARACIETCSCNEPKDCISQNISLASLEEVEIVGFKGENHDLDFLKLMLKCAPMLKKVTMKLGKNIKSYAQQDCSKKIYIISLAFPSVHFYVYVSCGRLVLHPCSPCS